jgi:hypothetical protein
MPERHTDDPDPGDAPDPDYRRLLDGYAEPGRLRRLKDRQQRRRPLDVAGWASSQAPIPLMRPVHIGTDRSSRLLAIDGEAESWMSRRSP